MSASTVIIRSDIENIISDPSDQYENNLQQELDELMYLDNDDEGENEVDLLSRQEDDSDSEEDILDINEDSAECSDRNYVSVDNIKTQSNSTLKINLYLTEEEQGIIDNCTDPKLKRLLLMNRTKAVHVKELCKKLYRLYDELGKNIRKEKEKFCQEESIKENQELQSMAKTYIWRIGIPFFKDKSFYSAPPNRDLAVKKENKEFFPTKIVEGRKWLTEDQQILRDAVLGNYFKYRKGGLEQDIRVLKARIKNATDEIAKAETAEDLECLEKKMVELKSMKNEPPPLNCDEGIDWFKIANFDLKARHTYLECKAFWNIYLHPSINKTDWLPEENEKIKELALQHNCDWDVIAAELGTNRSPYLVCVHYNTKLCDKFKRERFLPEEDEFLLEVVENCRLGDYIPWGRVAYYFEDRSKHQLYHRYKYYLSCKDVKKGTFTEAEDILLTYLTEKFGKNFSRIAELMPQRTSVQLRNRYSTYLQKLTIQLGNFTYEDDKKILNHVKVNGHKNWTVLAKELKRARAHVRQRYFTLRKYMEKYPDSTIDSLPRRKQTFLLNCQTMRNSRMVTCLEKLQTFQGIPTLATVETFVKQLDREVAKKEKHWRVLKAPMRKTRSLVDKRIIDFFKGSCKFHRETKVLDERIAADSAKRIIKLFDVLGADVQLLKNGEVAKGTFLLDIDKDMLTKIKEILQGNNFKLDSARRANRFTSETVENGAAIPGPSRLDPLSIEVPKNLIKHLLPPTPNTILCLRAMIIKYQLYKTANRNFTGIVKLESTKATPEDPRAWRIEQNLLEHDEFTRAKIEQERDLFYRRLWAILKWPCIMSKNFPERLASAEEEHQEEEEQDVIEEQQEKRKPGRPRKKVYSKILKMVEAKKRKRKDVAASTDGPDDMLSSTESHCSESTAETMANKETRPKKKGRPTNQTKNEHAVTYIPRRSHVKTNKSNLKLKQNGEMDVDDPNSEENETIGSNQSGNTASSSTIQTVNILDINLLNSDAVIVNEAEINNLIKLNNSKNGNKIVVLRTLPTVIINGRPMRSSSMMTETPQNAPHIEEIMVTESRPDLHLNTNQSNTDPLLQHDYLSMQDERITTMEHQIASPQICIDKQQWNYYRQKWRSLHLPEADKERLEQDLNEIETEAMVIGSEVDIPDEDVQTLDSSFDSVHFKAKSSTFEGSEEEDVSVDLSEDKTVADDSDNEEIKTVIADKLRNTRKLSATIQRMKERMRSSRNVK